MPAIANRRFHYSDEELAAYARQREKENRELQQKAEERRSEMEFRWAYDWLQSEYPELLEHKTFSPGEVKAVLDRGRWLVEDGQSVGSYRQDSFTREEAIAAFQGHRWHTHQ